MPGAVRSADLAGQELGVETVQGETVTALAAIDGAAKVGEATVVQADIEADNGVIHVIDTVIMPQM